MYVRSQFMLFCCRMCCFLCRKCCLLQCCCVIFMQIVLILCKLCCFYANCEVFMQIVLFWCKLWHLSQFTLFCRKWHFCREIRALAGTFGSAIRRLILLMMSALHLQDKCSLLLGAKKRKRRQSSLKRGPVTNPISTCACNLVTNIRQVKMWLQITQIYRPR